MKPFKPYIDFETAHKRAEELCKKLSLREKARFVQGYEMFFIRPMPEHGIPFVYMSDASQGIHIREDLDASMIRQPDRSVSYPGFIHLAAAWNPELAYEYGTSVGEECRAAGIHVLLGPAFNLYRNSQNGRSFEYLGEDPYLVSRIVEAYVPGIQNTGTMATIKHFICNNSDFLRRRSNSVVGPRALRELYLPGFKAGVDAGAMSVMTSYNLLNGEWCGQSGEVINGLLRGELGFKWLVMSDWTSVWDTAKMMTSGQDLDMPGPSVQDPEQLIREGKAAEADLDRMVTSIMTACIAMGFYDRDQKDESFTGRDREHEAVALRAAREGIVLLKNDNRALPLKGTDNILAFGDYMDSLPYGGGAATVEGYDNLLLGDALKNEFGGRIKVAAEPDDEEIRSADAVILSIGTFDSEGWDKSFYLPADKTEFIKKVCSLNPNTVVVVNTGSGIGMDSWNGLAAAVVYAWYPGQIGNLALAEILSGKTNPSGKLPITIEKRFEDSPAAGYLPEGEELYFDWPENELEHPVFDIDYKEDIFVGYRWYETKGIEPLYPFGHGLSYSTFTYSGLEVDQTGDHRVKVSFTVKNEGPFDGAETAEVYVSDTESSVPRPVKELKGFRKLFLKNGESARTEIILDKASFSFWDPKTQKWVLENGEFQILVGKSSADIVLTDAITL